MMKSNVYFIFVSIQLCLHLMLSPAKVHSKMLLKNTATTPPVAHFCHQLNQKIKKYYWGKIICNPKRWYWNVNFVTPGGNPLVYQIFEDGIPESTTMLFCGVHSDELPSIYFCIHLVRDILFDNPKLYKNSRIVVAPLINPDGFFIKKPTRQNGRGVDLNRNFPTKDFDKLALSQWKKRYRKDKRKYPGPYGASEIETRFQMMLIEKYVPDKIISVHSPYGWLDVDHPSDRKFSGDEPGHAMSFKKFLKDSKSIAQQMSKKGNNYRLINFRVYPGSLGNYAAYERSIPTYTLELPTSSASKAYHYWKRMKKAVLAAIQYRITRHRKIAVNKTNGDCKNNKNSAVKSFDCTTSRPSEVRN